MTAKAGGGAGPLTETGVTGTMIGMTGTMTGGQTEAGAAPDLQMGTGTEAVREGVTAGMTCTDTETDGIAQTAASTARAMTGLAAETTVTGL